MTTPNTIMQQINKGGLLYLDAAKRAMVKRYLIGECDFEPDDVIAAMEAENYGELASVFEPYYEDPVHASCDVILTILQEVYGFDQQ